MKAFSSYLRLLLNTFPLFWNSSKIYSCILLLIIPFQAILPSLILWFSKGLIDELSIGNYALIPFLAIAWIVVSFLSAILSPFEMTFQGLMTDKLIATINKELMTKSSKLRGLIYFEDSKFYDDIQVLEQEAAWRPVNLIVFFTGTISNFITGISMLILLSSFNLIISTVVIIAILPQAIVTYRLQKEAFETLVMNSPESRKMQYYTSVMLSKSHSKEVKLFNLGAFFIDKYHETFTGIHENIKKVRYKQAYYAILFIALGMAGIGGSFYWVIQGVINGTFTAGDILIFSSAVLLARQSLAGVIENSSLLYDTLLYMDKYFKFLSLPPDIPSGQKQLNNEDFVLEFKNVSFKYPNSPNFVLRNLNFSIKSGEKIALVGENGSGKSTIINLIIRFYEPTEGSIKLNKTDISEYELESYRTLIGAVFQDFSRYQLSYKENILIGNCHQNITDEDLKIVTKKSILEDLVDGFETKYNQILSKNFKNGTELSGGQWQKIAIARAYYRDAPFLILDEPSAALDAKSEDQLIRSLTDLSEENTLLLITHRLSALNMINRILVLKDGEIVEEGGLTDLMKNKGLFEELYRLQADKYNLK